MRNGGGEHCSVQAARTRFRVKKGAQHSTKVKKTIPSTRVAFSSEDTLCGWNGSPKKRDIFLDSWDIFLLGTAGLAWLGRVWVDLLVHRWQHLQHKSMNS